MDSEETENGFTEDHIAPECVLGPSLPPRSIPASVQIEGPGAVMGLQGASLRSPWFSLCPGDRHTGFHRLPSLALCIPFKGKARRLASPGSIPPAFLWPAWGRKVSPQSKEKAKKQ